VHLKLSDLLIIIIMIICDILLNILIIYVIHLMSFPLVHTDSALCMFRHGKFGATFMPGSVMSSEAILYAARPGLRLWKADINGIIDVTLIFTNSSDNLQPSYRNNSSPLTASLPQTETETAAVDFSTAQFGLLQVYCGDLVVSHTATDLLVISVEDPRQIMFMYSANGEAAILDVAVNRDEIFVLRKPSSRDTRPLVRLAQRPLCPQLLKSPSVAMSASCRYTKPYREFVR